MADWRAPRHIQWENVSDQTTNDDKRLPEGSLYSPEDFSRAFCQTRAGLRPIWNLKENWRDAHMGSRAEAGRVALTIVRYERNGGFDKEGWSQPEDP